MTTQATMPPTTQASEQPLRCAYCGTERPASELQTAAIWRNYRQVTALYCTDKPCALYAQMAAEG